MDQTEMGEAVLSHGAGVDTILPGQFGDLFRSAERTPEQRLMLALLEDAINCWLGGGNDSFIYGPWAANKRIRLAREADIWIFDDEAEPLVSFYTCCAALGIDGEWLRTKLRELGESAVCGKRLQRSSASAVRMGQGRRKIVLNQRFAVPSIPKSVSPAYAGERDMEEAV